MLSRIPFYPFFFSLFPIASLLSSNVGEARLSEAILPAAFVIFVNFALFLFLRAVLADTQKSAFVLFLFWPGFYCFGPLLDLLHSQVELSVA